MINVMILIYISDEGGIPRRTSSGVRPPIKDKAVYSAYRACPPLTAINLYMYIYLFPFWF